MKSGDICEQIAVHAIERVFCGEWQHEGYLLGCSSKHVNFELDGKEYVLVLTEITEGHSFSEHLEG